MATSSEILEQAQTLPEEERLTVGLKIVESVQKEPDLSDEQQAEIEQTLLDRADGPWIPYDRGMADRIKARGRERLKQRLNAEA